jgi:hypothetical protein
MKKSQAIHKPRRFKRKKSIIKSRILGRLILFLILFAEIFYVFFFFSYFQIKKIEILGNQKTSAQEIQNIVKPQIRTKIIFWKTESIFFQNFKKINKTLLEKFPPIENTIFKKNFPDGLIIQIIERETIGKYCVSNTTDNEASNNKNFDNTIIIPEKKIAAFDEANAKQLNSEQCYFFDKTGIIFYLAKNQNFSASTEAEGNELIIRANENQTTTSPRAKHSFGAGINLGQKMFTKEILDLILKIQNKIEKDIKINIKEFVIGPEKIIAKTPEKWEIYFLPEDEEANSSLFKLQLLLEKAIPVEKRKNLEYIDLRFTKAYFKYK